MAVISDVSDPVAVIGAGSWGTALAISLASAGHTVHLWARSAEAADKMQRLRKNPTYLPESEIPDNVFVTSDLNAAVSNSKFWVFATPSQAVRAVAQRAEPMVSGSNTIVSVAKGIENESLMTTTQVLRDVLKTVPKEQIGVLYGPSHAEEVASGIPTAVVAAAGSNEAAARIQSMFTAPRFRVYVNPDLLGVEIAGSVKNVLAIATGIVEGVGFGVNTRAALITRGLSEIRRLGTAMGASPATFSGLAGIGDIVVTCMSSLSRNRYVGEQIGQGKKLSEVEAEMSMVAEGVRTTQSVCMLAENYDVEMPITAAVESILFYGKGPVVAIEELMARTVKSEDWLQGDPAEDKG